MKQCYFLLAALGMIIMHSCSEAKSTNKKKDEIKTVSVKKDTLVSDSLKTVALQDSVPQAVEKNRFNEISAILAGMQDEGNALNYLFDTIAWKENREFMNASWKKLETNRLNKLSKWGDKELIQANKNCKTVFYPFSGPDFITANAFFPKADKMIMLGLEPIGSLPQLDKFDGQDSKDYANDFRKSLTDIFEKSYFITQYMLRDFQKQKVNGLLPVLCFFIKKTNHQIVDIKYLVKKNNDSIEEVDYDTRKNFFGVKVICKKDTLTKTIYYFRYDVSNKQFNDTCVFYKFINKQTPNSVTYVKSASYLLHANFMSNMKKLILNNSNYLLQDDTGIPYDDIDKTKLFTIKLYGKYVQPVKNFPYLRMQKGIVKAFETDSASIPDLPFHLGYHWQSKKDLLMLATKIQTKK
ncbi:MAG: hypothetical protein IT236_09495 [Bacteroidia bacterium]|nr:hypothetical protein [Bacteroidia bacterium]